MYTRAAVPSSKLRVAEVSQVSTGISTSNVNVVIRKRTTRQWRVFNGYS
jgi:hypothetical protein